MRFLADFFSGTFSKYHAGSVLSGSSPPIEAKPGLPPGSSGRPSTSDQKPPILRASSQSTLMLITRAGIQVLLLRVLPILTQHQDVMTCRSSRHHSGSRCTEIN